MVSPVNVNNLSARKKPAPIFIQGRLLSFCLLEENTMTTSENVRNQLETLIRDRKGLNIDLLFKYAGGFCNLHEVLNPDEKILEYCFSNLSQTGRKLPAGDWLIVCTDQRVICHHHGYITKTVHLSIPLASIKSIKPKSGWLFVGLIIQDQTSEIELFHANRPSLKLFIPVLQRTLEGAKKF